MSPDVDTVEKTSAATTEAGGHTPVVDRGRDADRLTDIIRDSSHRLILLHGRRRSGKSDFVRNWLIPRLRAAGSGTHVVYGTCEPDLPRQFDSGSESISLDDAFARPGIIVVDSFERFLAQPRDERREITERAFRRFDNVGTEVKVVLITDSRQLTNAYFLTAYDPGVIGAVYEIPAVPLESGLQNLGARRGVERLEYAGEAVDQLRKEAQELENENWEVTFDLIQLLDRRLRAYAAEHSTRTIDGEALKALGGVAGILREYFAVRVERSPYDTDTEREILQVVLECIVDAMRNGRPWSPGDIAPRAGVNEPEIEAIMAWLTSPDGLLLRLDHHQYEVVPAPVGKVIVDEENGRRLMIDRILRVVDDGIRSWELFGSVMAPHRFAEVHRARRFLVLDDARIRFLFLSALQLDATGGESPDVYWLGRISDRTDACDILLSSLFDESSTVRIRAADLLKGLVRLYQREGEAGLESLTEIRERLLIVALTDSEGDVRKAVIRTLRLMKEDAGQHQAFHELRDRMLAEIRNPASPYRTNAIEVLGLFPEDTVAAELQNLVKPPQTDAAIRDRAIRVLCSLELPMAVDALIDIAESDPDQADREAAGSALAVTRSSYLGERLLTKLETFRRIPISWLYVGVFVWLVVVVSGTGILLDQGEETLVAVSLLAGMVLIVPTGWLLRRMRDEKIVRRSAMGALTIALFMVSASTILLFVHGLAHLLIGRRRRAAWLFALWVASVYLVNSGSTLPGSAIYFLYFGTGILLFLATYVFDVGGVIAQIFLETTKNAPFRRQAAMFAKAISNPLAARAVFNELAATGQRRVRRVKSFLRTAGKHVPPDFLVEVVKEGTVAQTRIATRILKRAKTEETVRNLSALWPVANTRLRSSIVKILCGRPTQGSLQAVKKFKADMGAGMRVRVAGAEFMLPIVVLPPWARVVILPTVLVASFFIYNGLRSWSDPAWSQLGALRRSIHPGFVARVFFKPVRNEESTRRLIGFLADNHPDQSAEVFLSHLRESRGHPGLRAALASAIIVMASAPRGEMDVRTQTLLSRADSAVLKEVFYADTVTLRETLERIGRRAYHPDRSVVQASLRQLSRLALEEVPDPSELTGTSRTWFAGDTWGDSAFAERMGEHYRKGDFMKMSAVRTMGTFPYPEALPALHALLNARSQFPIAHEIRLAMKRVVERAKDTARRSSDKAGDAMMLLTVVAALDSVSALTGEVRQFMDSLNAKEPRVVLQNPYAEDEYAIIVSEHEQSGRAPAAVPLLSQLKSSYPTSIWPRKYLSMLHHETLALTSDASFVESNREMRELIQMDEFRSLRTRDSLTYYRILSDYHEIALSARDSFTIDSLAGELTGVGRDPVHRFNAALFVYLDRVLARNAAQATVALNRLEQITSELQNDFYNNWRYPGTRALIERSSLAADVRTALLELCKEGYWFTQTELKGVLDRNRSAVRTIR